MDVDLYQYPWCNTEYQEEKGLFCHLYRGKYRMDRGKYISWNLRTGSTLRGLHRPFHLGMDRMGTKGMEKGIAAGKFETFDHLADIGIRGWGKTLEEAFENAAIAMFSIIVENLDRVTPQKQIEISCESIDREGLFVAWLNELLAQAGIRNMVFSRFKCHIQNLALEGLAYGERFDPNKHRRGIEVKGATFTQLAVRKQNGLWLAQCVVDV